MKTKTSRKWRYATLETELFRAEELGRSREFACRMMLCNINAALSNGGSVTVRYSDKLNDGRFYSGRDAELGVSFQVQNGHIVELRGGKVVDAEVDSHRISCLIPRPF